MRSQIRLLFAACVLLLSGCAPQQTSGGAYDATAKSIVGKWASQFSTSSGVMGMSTVTYKADGTRLQHTEGDGKTLDIEGRYSLKDGELTQTFVSAKSNGKNIDPPREKIRKFHVEIRGNDMRITIPGEPGDQTFKRIGY